MLHFPSNYLTISGSSEETFQFLKRFQLLRQNKYAKFQFGGQILQRLRISDEIN